MGNEPRAEGTQGQRIFAFSDQSASSILITCTEEKGPGERVNITVEEKGGWWCNTVPRAVLGWCLVGIWGGWPQLVGGRSLSVVRGESVEYRVRMKRESLRVSETSGSPPLIASVSALQWEMKSSPESHNGGKGVKSLGREA